MAERDDSVRHDIRITTNDWVYALGAVTGVGGTETRMSEAARTVVRRGGRVRAVIWSASRDTSIVRMMEDAGVEVHTTQSVLSYLFFLGASRRAAIFTFGLRPSLAARLLRFSIRRHGSVLSLRNGLDAGWSAWMHRVDRLSSRWQDGYLVNSQAVRDHLIKWGAKPDNIFLVEGALSEEWFTPADHIKRSRPVMAMVGNDRPEKNQLFGLKTMLRLEPSSVAIRVYTDNATRLREAVDQHSSLVIDFIEQRRLGPSDFDDIDILVMPSLSESLPRAILEARARGCQIVTSNVGSSASMIDTATSSVVDGFEPSEWETAFRRAIERHRVARRVTSHMIRTTGDYVADIDRITRGLTP